MGTTIDLNAVKLSGLTSDEKLWIYNGLDCIYTEEIHHILKPKVEKRALTTYNFSLGMRAPALAMMKRGMLVDVRERDRLIAELKPRLLALTGMEKRTQKNGKEKWEIVDTGALVQQMHIALTGKPININSTPQLSTLFYKTLKVPPYFKFEKGKRKLSIERDILEKFVYLYPRAAAFASILIEVRDINKTLQVLQAPLTTDQRLTTSYNVVGTETGRWCVDGQTEFLTPEGWIRFDSIEYDSQGKSSTKLAVWDKQGTINFQDGNLVKFLMNTDQEMVEITSNKFSLVATKEHRLPYFTSKKQFKVAAAGEMRRLHSVPIAGVLQDVGFELEDKTKLAVAIQADATILTNGKIRFHFRKERKINRCKQLLNTLNTDYRVATSKDGSTYIYINAPEGWMYTAKTFGPWVLKHNPAVFCAELVHWDGNLDGKYGLVYYTSNALNAEWVKTMAHLAGKSASIRVKRVQSSTWATAYRVHIGKYTTTRLSSEDYTPIVGVNSVYCAETSTGFFLVRRNGEISVTGNSSSESAFYLGTNLQNITKELRSIVVPDPGYTMFYADLKSAESFVVGHVAQDEAYIDACTSGDIHTYVARLAYPELPWTGNITKDKEIAEASRIYRDKSARYMCKRVGHGSNYFGKPPTIAKQAQLEQHVVKVFQARYYGGKLLVSDLRRWGYRDLIASSEVRGSGLQQYVELEGAFPGIRKWHDEVAETLQTVGSITTCFGRTRQFWGRAWEDATLREAIAYDPQSTVGDLLNIGLYRVYTELELKGDLQVLGQGHDAIVGQVPIGMETVYDPMIKDLMQINVPIKGRTMMIPVDVKWGNNWKDIS